MYSIWRQRSIGLGTPNSASGEAELMFILSSPQIKKPRKGDLYINKKIKELKGEEARVNGNISGKQFRKKTIDIAKKYNLTLNKSAKSEKYSAELEKTKHLKHWKNELNKLTLNKQKSFIYEWLKCVSYDFEYENINKNENKIFINGKFNHKNFIKEIVKLLFNETIKNNNFDSFILLGDGTNTKVINGNKDVFNEKIDNGEIIINKDYFRINQPGMIGWYIE